MTASQHWWNNILLMLGSGLMVIMIKVWEGKSALPVAGTPYTYFLVICRQMDDDFTYMSSYVL